jgi:hypothetical protein
VPEPDTRNHTVKGDTIGLVGGVVLIGSGIFAAMEILAEAILGVDALVTVDSCLLPSA